MPKIEVLLLHYVWQQSKCLLIIYAKCLCETFGKKSCLVSINTSISIKLNRKNLLTSLFSSLQLYHLPYAIPFQSIHLFLYRLCPIWISKCCLFSLEYISFCHRGSEVSKDRRQLFVRHEPGYGMLCT